MKPSDFKAYWWERVTSLWRIGFFYPVLSGIPANRAIIPSQQQALWCTHVRLSLKKTCVLLRTNFGERTTLLYKNQIKWHAKITFISIYKQTICYMQKHGFVFDYFLILFIVLCIMSFFIWTKICSRKFNSSFAKSLLISHKVRWYLADFFITGCKTFITLFIDEEKSF